MERCSHCSFVVGYNAEIVDGKIFHPKCAIDFAYRNHITIVQVKELAKWFDYIRQMDPRDVIEQQANIHTVHNILKPLMRGVKC